MKKFLVVVLFALAFYLYDHSRHVTLGPGVSAAEPPLQRVIDSPVTFEFETYNLSPLARFELKAKVLSKENYYLGREADLSPTDLALGWGTMSDESILEQIDISQSGRFYRWRVDSFPIPRKDIETQSANMHLIPADTLVRDAISRVRKGDLIEMSGYLVNVVSNDGSWYWKSSLTRNDTGGGACELVFVESLAIVTANY
ncbi:hypothetical protein [Agaribacterium sp. ZY112]|uniref:hypothetical protein n=1 Tax=Agaribacterium sp. ZY112 TaxID=3233574 RepID=UPI00352430C5